MPAGSSANGGSLATWRHSSALHFSDYCLAQEFEPPRVARGDGRVRDLKPAREHFYDSEVTVVEHEPGGGCDGRCDCGRDYAQREQTWTYPMSYILFMAVLP